MAKGHCISFYLSACLGGYIISSVIRVSEASYSFGAEQHDDEYSFPVSRDRRQTFHKKTNCTPLIQDNETYYSMNIFEDAVDDYWTDITDEGKQINTNSHVYPKIDLPFKFSFYGRPINHVFASTLGYMWMSEYPNETHPSHVTAPLFAHFINYTAAAFYESQGDKFIIEWRDVFLNNSGPNLFQTVVFQNGTIMFLYKKIGRDVPRKSFMASISSGLVLEIHGTGGKKALIRYQPLVLNPENIETGTVVIFTPLSLCELSEDTQLCETRHVSFYCKHCRVKKHCPWSIDKLVQQWFYQYCKNTKPPGCAPDKEEEGVSSTYIAIVVVVVIVFILISILGGWTYYAYNNPTTASGRWLIEHRPSQWKSWCFERTNTTKADDKSPSNDDDDDSLPKDGDISPDF